MNHNKIQTGTLGESWIVYQLAKRNIIAYKLPHSFDYDLILQNGLRIEVKTSVISKNYKKYKDKIYVSEQWHFANQTTKFHGISQEGYSRKASYSIESRDRKCDYFVFVCLNENYEPERTYIVPKDIIKQQRVITISKNYDKTKLTQYVEKWDYLIK